MAHGFLWSDTCMEEDEDGFESEPCPNTGRPHVYKEVVVEGDNVMMQCKCGKTLTEVDYVMRS